MDPKKTKQLLEEVCDDIAARKARASRTVKAVGVGVALGFAVACGPTDLYGTPPPEDTADVVDEEVTGPVDLYGVQMDTAEDVQDEEVSGPVDLYGIQADATNADVVDEEVSGPVDLYGIQPDAGP